MPIRGATGGGYGQFQWGTSLATVRRLTPKLSRVKSVKQCLEEEKYLKGLARARNIRKRQKNRWPSGVPTRVAITRYHHWVSVNGLQGRVEYAFFQDQLFEVILRLIYQRKQKKKKSQIIRRLVRKYGSPKPTQDGEVPPLTAGHLVFEKMDGMVTIDHLIPRKKKGFLRLVYRDRVIHGAALAYLQKLQAFWARLAPKANRRLPRKKPKRPTHSIDQHI